MTKLGWESFLKAATLATFAIIVTMALAIYFFQNNGSVSFWLGVTLMLSVVAFIVLRLVWRVTTKKFPF